MINDTDSPTVSFPAVAAQDQDAEWCIVEEAGEQRRIRFHDYDEIFSVPGLYEQIFYEHLECQSPGEIAGLLGDELARAGVDPATLSGVDVGAGNGMVGEELQALGITPLVGVDILPEAGAAAGRDRPGVYADYVVCDLTDLGAGERDRIGRHRPDVMTTVAALGYGDMPPAAFAGAFAFLRDGGWFAFNIKKDFLDAADRSGFAALVERMADEGVLEECARRVYPHRRSMTGEVLEYVGVVGRKRAELPAEWLATG